MRLGAIGGRRRGALSRRRRRNVWPTAGTRAGEGAWRAPYDRDAAAHLVSRDRAREGRFGRQAADVDGSRKAYVASRSDRGVGDLRRAQSALKRTAQALALLLQCERDGLRPFA